MKHFDQEYLFQVGRCLFTYIRAKFTKCLRNGAANTATIVQIFHILRNGAKDRILNWYFFNYALTGAGRGRICSAPFYSLYFRNTISLLYSLKIHSSSNSGIITTFIIFTHCTFPFLLSSSFSVKDIKIGQNLKFILNFQVPVDQKTAFYQANILA